MGLFWRWRKQRQMSLRKMLGKRCWITKDFTEIQNHLKNLCQKRAQQGKSVFWTNKKKNIHQIKHFRKTVIYSKRCLRPQSWSHSSHNIISTTDLYLRWTSNFWPHTSMEEATTAHHPHNQTLQLCQPVWKKKKQNIPLPPDQSS